MQRCPQGCNSKPYIHGRHGKQNTPRFKCPTSGKTFSQSKRVCESLNIPKETVYRILSCLTKGCGVRATARLNQVHAETVLKVLRIAGEKAESVPDRKLRNIRATQVQIDEAWTSCKRNSAVYNRTNIQTTAISYNFTTVHSSFKQTPVQAAGIAESVWTWGDLFAM